ncbi:glycoside hydrolase family protein [Mucisphaera calidilacus]|uniref:Non-reducing end beta-L-arabinofuranosidase n=1 Tax=Mucisphaera calidilacus TaxID=2527982 RepID=A0A518C090_9BACT|nr:beta-L-arabinofuranosidase domain-containing protein [Mucisphaera calidilacus]QDU72640.1 hypothetical protein Pan265_25120 [Mucisphaera calidilacus]
MNSGTRTIPDTPAVVVSQSVQVPPRRRKSRVLSVTASGNLAKRVLLSYERLLMSPYTAEEIFTHTPGYEWPGDYEGRALLAASRLSATSGMAHPLVETLDKGWERHVNRQGYFGAIVSSGLADEQQLSSHGWVLRGLGAAYDVTGDPRWLVRGRRVVDGLTQGLKGLIASYPLTPPSSGDRSGLHAGHLSQAIDGWRISTDVGCAFIFLDGLTSFYRHYASEELRDLISAMAERFLLIDVVQAQAQTHATLTACRALLRAARILNRPDLIDSVESRFDLYLQYGSTALYQNQNWFGRPSWTEPCAIVDAMMVAEHLWQAKGQFRHLKALHGIWYSGLGHAQRCNGGYGCDSCVGVRGHHVGISTPEAPWCCTMRGADGLAYAAASALRVVDKQISLGLLESVQAELSLGGERLQLKIDSGYPREGRLVVEVLSSSISESICWRLPVLDDEDPIIRIDGIAHPVERVGQWSVFEFMPKAGSRIECTWRMAWTLDAWSHDSDRVRIQWGPLVLGSYSMPWLIGDQLHPERLEVSEPATLIDRVSGAVLRPLDDMVHRSMPDSTYQRQVLFRRG